MTAADGSAARDVLCLVHAFISSRLDYCNSLLFGVANQQLKRLQSVQNAAARLVTGTRRSDHITPVLPRVASPAAHTVQNVDAGAQVPK